MNELAVYMDFKRPYPFIAKDPTYQLEDEFGIEIDWYPLTLNIGSYLGTAKKNEAGKVVESDRSSNQWLSVKYAYKDARRYAKLLDLTLYGKQKIWETSLSGIGMLWAKQQGHEILKHYIDLTYDRFWKRESDVEDLSVVERVLQEAGAEVAGFADWQAGEGRTLHDTLQMELLTSGVYGVPTYRIDGETYFGREHLPRVRWHLSGKQGPLPDIANDSVMKSLPPSWMSTSILAILRAMPRYRGYNS